MLYNDPAQVLSPLADPVVSAIFINEQESGLAAQSIINCTLEPEDKLLGKIVRITSQQAFTDPSSRGSRVDVDAETNSNERVIFEINIYPDKTIMHRNWHAGSHIFREATSPGDTTVQMLAKVPRMIFINILGYNIRDDNTELVQPFKNIFTKPPYKVAIPQFSGYNIQLPRILEMEPDFNDGLYCWCYTLYTAHLEKKTIQEVLAMTSELQSYAERDEGYFQFCQRYGMVSADPDTRHQYYLWTMSKLKEWGIRQTAIEEGLEEGLTKGMAQGLEQGLEQGQIKRLVFQIHRKKLKNKSREQIIDELEMDEDSLNILDNFDSYLHLL